MFWAVQYVMRRDPDLVTWCKSPLTNYSTQRKPPFWEAEFVLHCQGYISHLINKFMLKSELTCDSYQQDRSPPPPVFAGCITKSSGCEKQVHVTHIVQILSSLTPLSNWNISYNNKKKMIDLHNVTRCRMPVLRIIFRRARLLIRISHICVWASF